VDSNGDGDDLNTIVDLGLPENKQNRQAEESYVLNVQGGGSACTRTDCTQPF